MQITAALVDRFLQWPLPHSVCADLVATKQGPGRIGTNLLTATEARQMLEFVLGPPPLPNESDTPETSERKYSDALTSRQYALDSCVIEQEAAALSLQAKEKTAAIQCPRCYRMVTGSCGPNCAWEWNKEDSEII